MHKLKFKFKPGMMPRFGIEYTTCIGGCDEIFNDNMDIKLNNVRKTGRPNDSGYSSNHSLNSTQRSSQNTAPSQRNNNTNNSTNNSRSMSQPGTNQGNSNNANQFKKPDNTRLQNGWSSQNNRNNQESRTNVGMVSSNVNSNSNNSGSNNWGHVDDGSPMLCNCHSTAVRLTVRKEGPNQGTIEFQLFGSVQY